ncbi:Uncharacterized membrane protein YckC, RDD family [Formosa sp. Hel1_31_208]|uniref:RDD family protein n=1 Tax=Formosa sp. Hel1_31_208 TaxID=1798225 RepID=UPI00087C160E|nr:RDD family protein [Formosa sp. Hel1_31_208]SDR68717.1 Uncharacterized membrane protein YckC, RDD family [Formosa sp. Hel1_31_208]
MNTIEHTVTKDVLSSKSIRFLNYIIDYVIQIAIGMLIGFVIGIMAELTGDYTLADTFLYSESRLVDFAFGYFVLMIYYTTIETFTGRSIGKYITNTKVVCYDGSKPKFKDILVRSLCRIIPFEQFSFLGEDGKGWHDSISKTYVVDVKKYNAKKETLEGLEEIGRIGE